MRVLTLKELLTIMMKYKHKHTGQVVTKGTDGLYHSQEGGYTLQRWIFENSNDWEEIKEEPNYLITAFRSKKNKEIVSLESDGKYYNYGREFSENEMIDCPFTEIYSIKNEFGKEFCIGNKVKGDNEEFIIDSFQLGEHILGGCYACGQDKQGTVKVSIKIIEIIKTPIYTTTDGVDIEEGDDINLFIATKQLTIPQINTVNTYWFRNSDKEVAERYLTFTSAESRDKYIKEHTRKPIFVSADGKEVFDEHNFGTNLFSVYPREAWTEKRCTVKQAIEFKNWLHFHTKEARQEYIDNNKPKFSLADIEKAYSETNSPISSPLFQNFKYILLNK